MSRFESVWGFPGIDHETDDLENRSDYLILIQARLHGISGSEEEKVELFGLTLEQISDVMKGRAEKFSLSELTAIARKVGVVARP